MTRAPLGTVRRAGVLIITANPHQSRTTYLVASIPGWIVAGILALLLHRLAGVPALAALAVLVVWIATDIAMYPRMRRY